MDWKWWTKMLSVFWKLECKIGSWWHYGFNMTEQAFLFLSFLSYLAHSLLPGWDWTELGEKEIGWNTFSVMVWVKILKMVLGDELPYELSGSPCNSALSLSPDHSERLCLQPLPSRPRQRSSHCLECAWQRNEENDWSTNRLPKLPPLWHFLLINFTCYWMEQVTLTVIGVEEHDSSCLLETQLKTLYHWTNQATFIAFFLFLLFFLFFFLFWNRVLLYNLDLWLELCNPNCPQMYNPPALTSINVRFAGIYHNTHCLFVFVFILNQSFTLLPRLDSNLQSCVTLSSSWDCRCASLCQQEKKGLKKISQGIIHREGWVYSAS